MRSLVPLVLVLVVGASAAPGAAQPQEGLGVSPPVVRLDAALPDEAYVAHVSLQNGFASESTITIQRSGTLGAWTTTVPSDGFAVAAKTTRDVTVRILVPGDASPGEHAGELRFVAEPKEPPTGSGFAVRYAIVVALQALVGGEAVERVTWLGASARDVEHGSPPQVVATVRNDGNVRTLAGVDVEVRPAAGGAVLESARGASEVLPGETTTLPLPLGEALPEGQYVARVRAGDAFDQSIPFKVVAPGLLGKDAQLRQIRHDAWARAGDPVRIDVVLSNTGSLGIAQAVFRGEVREGSRLVAVLESPARVVPVGETVDLTVYLDAPAQGVYRVVGRVDYDGFQTPPSESRLNVLGGPDAARPSWLLLAALVAAGVGGMLVVGIVLGRRRRRR